MSNAQFGMIGLGTMGRNFLLNIAENGFSCAGYDLDAEKRQLLLAEGANMPITAAETIQEFVAQLAAPRNIMLLVPAGKAHRPPTPNPTTSLVHSDRQPAP